MNPVAWIRTHLRSENSKKNSFFGFGVQLREYDRTGQLLMILLPTIRKGFGWRLLFVHVRYPIEAKLHIARALSHLPFLRKMALARAKFRTAILVANRDERKLASCAADLFDSSPVALISGA